MAKRSVKMTLSEKGYKRFKTLMKKMGFTNTDLFLRYCVLKAVKPKLSETQKKLAAKEMKLIKEREKGKR
jgi:hypothetical protein